MDLSTLTTKDWVSLIVSSFAIIISIGTFIWNVIAKRISSKAKIKTDINIWNGPELGMNLKNYGGGPAILKKCKIKYKNSLIDFSDNVELIRMCSELRLQLAYMGVTNVVVNEINDGHYVSTSDDRKVIVVKTKDDAPLEEKFFKEFGEILCKVEIIGKYKSAYPFARLKNIDS